MHYVGAIFPKPWVGDAGCCILHSMHAHARCCPTENEACIYSLVSRGTRTMILEIKNCMQNASVHLPCRVLLSLSHGMSEFDPLQTSVKLGLIRHTYGNDSRPFQSTP